MNDDMLACVCLEINFVSIILAECLLEKSGHNIIKYQSSTWQYFFSEMY